MSLKHGNERSEPASQGGYGLARRVEVVFTTVVRAAPVHQGGEVVLLNWDTKDILCRRGVGPLDETLDDPSPRGNARGGRGVWVTGTRILVASYDGIAVLDRGLARLRAVSNGLMVDVHEVAMDPSGTLWVASTAVDGVLEVDLESGRILRQYWPREMATFQAELAVEPGSLDRSADQRKALLSQGHARQRSHLHLNAVALWRGEVLALLNRFGAVVNLDRGQVLFRDDAIRGGHNLVVARDTLYVSATRDHAVREYDLPSGRLRRVVRLTDYGWVRSLIAGGLATRSRQVLDRLRGRPVVASPGFVRGLDVLGDRLFVGLSPASVICIELETATLVDAYRYAGDVRVCVHGLQAVHAGVATPAPAAYPGSSP